MDDLHQLHPNGLFLRREALDHGYTDRDLARARRVGALVRVRQGTYVANRTWSEAPAVERHLLRAQGVLLTHENRVALSHATGALALGIDLWQPNLDQVHVTRLDGTTGRSEPDISYHRHAWNPDELVQVGESLTLDPSRCALQAASLMSVEGGMVALDALVESGLGDLESLHAAYESLSRSPFSRRLQIALRLCRKGAQSVGESRTRYLFWAQHLPQPVLQYEVLHHGVLVGITDFAWPEYGLLGEFDGKVKYGRLRYPGETEGDAVYREKKREDKLREITGMGMIRYTYGDLFVPRKTAARTRRMLMISRAA